MSLPFTMSSSTEPWSGRGAAREAAQWLKAEWWLWLAALRRCQPSSSASPAALEQELHSLGFLSCANRGLFPAEEETELCRGAWTRRLNKQIPA